MELNQITNEENGNRDEANNGKNNLNREENK
jgi:hypothetical protein